MKKPIRPATNATDPLGGAERKSAPMPLGRMVEVLRGTINEKFDPVQYREFSDVAFLLSLTLEAAVPLHVYELELDRERLGNGMFWEAAEKEAKACADEVAEHGDRLMFRGKKGGESARVFNALARGVAILSFCPGGVTLFGTHWERERVRIPVQVAGKES